MATFNKPKLEGKKEVAYAPNFTARYRIKYRSRNTQYQSTFRVFSGAAQEEVAAFVETFLDALSDLRASDWTLTGADYSAAGTNFFVPATEVPSPEAGTAQVASEAFRANFLSFTGKSAIANPSRIFLYGVTVNPLESSNGVRTDYRLTTAESVSVLAAQVALLSAQDILVASDDNPVVSWNAYANVGLNAYRQRKIRRG